MAVNATDAMEFTPYQRAAVVMWELSRGQALRTEEVMRLTGLRRSGALRLLGQLCGLRGCAVYEAEKGVWRVLGEG